MVVAWDRSKVKEVLQGEAMCGRSKGVTLLQRKQGSLLQKSKEDCYCYKGNKRAGVTQAP